jgi:PhnB protein
MQLIPYLNFNGRCAEAFRFYEQTLGGRITMMQTHGESPIAADVPREWHGRILHARLELGHAVLMASDSPPEYYQPPQGLWVNLQVDRPADADRIFDALADDGNVTMPLQPTFWAARFGMVVDRFGTPWMINCAPTD